MFDSLLPPNATVAELAQEGATSRVSSVPVPVRDMWNADTCPANLLPWLAWAFSIDNWNTNWTEEQKRNAVKAAYVVHTQKGTIGAVRRSLEALGLGMQVIEWFNDDPVGDPYTFRITLDAQFGEITQAALTNALTVIRSAKNLRSHLASVTLAILSQATVFVGAYALIGVELTVGTAITTGLQMVTEDGFTLVSEDGDPIVTE